MFTSKCPIMFAIDISDSCEVLEVIQNKALCNFVALIIIFINAYRLPRSASAMLPKLPMHRVLLEQLVFFTVQ